MKPNAAAATMPGEPATISQSGASPPSSLTEALYTRTKALHVEAEKSGVIRDLLRGTASNESYALLMRNLLPAYHALEDGLRRHRTSMPVRTIAKHDLDRAPRIEADLDVLCGPGWRATLPLLPAGVNYADRVTQAAQGEGAGLIAHAYTRYLGDLSGGVILKRLLERSLALPASALSFYDFPGIKDLGEFKTVYRDAIDAAGKTLSDHGPVVDEGAQAFTHNIDVSCAVKAYADETPAEHGDVREV